MPSIGDLFKVFQKGFIRNALEGAGIALATSGTTLIVLKQMIDHFKSNVNSMPSMVLQFAGISGLDIFFSLVLGAVVARNYADSAKLFLKKK